METVMNTKARILVMAALPFTALAAGCTSVADHEFIGYKDPTWGDANRSTFAAQVVNPDPVYDDPIPATSADHAVDAIDRYRDDQVKQPERISTTEGVQSN